MKEKSLAPSSEGSFNTDDGIRRAAILENTFAKGFDRRSFNTDDGIRRAAIEKAYTKAYREQVRFNTDDGIRRAAIPRPEHPGHDF